MNKILLVDDEEMIRNPVSMSLENAGMLTDTAANLTEAKDKVLYDDVAVVVTDILLGEENGWELIKYIKKHRADINIMVITADSDSRNKAIRLADMGEIWAYFDKGGLDQEAIISHCRKALDDDFEN